ncbi:helix-turn-helix domain-containing protein [Streptomyces sp. NPDC004609]|uniref:AraC-like ligand-binding domain-containing protein n=1 Tax=Streptomyces sp. NPDC004609 TaxID=3364704 RepID=UPI0036B6223E
MTEFRTDALDAPERRVDQFEKAVGQWHVPHRFRSGEDDFAAGMRVLSLGDLQVSTLTYPRLDVARTPRLIRQCDPEVFHLVYMVKGHADIFAATSDNRVETGALVILDSSSPYQVHCADSAGSLTSIVAQIPRSMLPLSPRAVRRALGVAVPLDGGMGGVLSRWLTDLIGHAHEFTPADVPTLADITSSLLGSVLGRFLDAEDTVPAEARRRALRRRIRDFIRRNLGDPSLTPTAVAAAHEVSLRHLHQLFAADDITPAAWIRRQRLDRCRRDLANPHLVSRPIHSIAARWGFTDPGHFSRVFRAAYDLTPRDYRYRALNRVREQSVGVRWGAAGRAAEWTGFGLPADPGVRGRGGPDAA